MTIDLDDILHLAKEAAMLAGAEIRAALMARSGDSPPDDDNVEDNGNHQNDSNNHDHNNKIAIKSDTTDLVTETDIRCEELITKLIAQHYPTHCIIGEESSGADCQYQLTNAPTWTIDPIDGTTNFVHGLALTCVLISFLQDKQPMVGVIYDPLAEEMFWAVLGRGAYRTCFRQRGTKNSSTTKLSVSRTTELPQAVVAIDAGYGRSTESVDKFLAIQRAILLKRVRNIRIFGCCGLTMAYVACGRLDACLEKGSWSLNTGPKIWDFAPGLLIVREAGGVTRNLEQRSSNCTEELDLLGRSVFAAASPELATALLETIQNLDF